GRGVAACRRGADDGTETDGERQYRWADAGDGSLAAGRAGGGAALLPASAGGAEERSAEKWLRPSPLAIPGSRVAWNQGRVRGEVPRAAAPASLQTFWHGPPAAGAGGGAISSYDEGVRARSSGTDPLAPRAAGEALARKRANVSAVRQLYLWANPSAA